MIMDKDKNSIYITEPDYKNEYFRLKEELHAVKLENERLVKAIVNIACKLD